MEPNEDDLAKELLRVYKELVESQLGRDIELDELIAEDLWDLFEE